MAYETLPPLTPEQCAASAQSMARARAVMQGFIADASMAHMFSRETAWSSFVSTSREDGMLAKADPRTQHSHTAKIIDGMASRLIQTRMGGADRQKIIEHMQLERKKAQHKMALYHAAHLLMKEHPQPNKSTEHHADIYGDRCRQAKKWLDDLARPARKPGVNAAQQGLF